MHGLRHAAGHLQSRLGDFVRLRRVPKLTFRVDRALKKSADVYTALRSVVPAPDPDPDPAPDQANDDQGDAPPGPQWEDQPS